MPKELEEMLDAFITREEDEIEMSAFFQTWARIEAERRASAEEIHLWREIVGDRPVLAAPKSQSARLRVHGNEIVLEDGQRILLKLKPGELAPA